MKQSVQPCSSSNQVLVIMMVLAFWEMIAAAASSLIGLVLGIAKFAAVVAYALLTAKNKKRMACILGFIYASAHLICDLIFAAALYHGAIMGKTESFICYDFNFSADALVPTELNIGAALTISALILIYIFYSKPLSDKKVKILKVILCSVLAAISLCFGLQFFQINWKLAIFRAMQLNNAAVVLLIACAHISCQVCGDKASTDTIFCKKCGRKIER